MGIDKGEIFGFLQNVLIAAMILLMTAIVILAHKTETVAPPKTPSATDNIKNESNNTPGHEAGKEDADGNRPK